MCCVVKVVLFVSVEVMFFVEVSVVWSGETYCSLLLVLYRDIRVIGVGCCSMALVLIVSSCASVSAVMSAVSGILLVCVGKL